MRSQSTVPLVLIDEDAPFYGVYTFGQPRAGDRTFSRIYNVEAASRTYRFQNNNDIVTRIPARIMGYSHVGKFVYISDKKRLSTDSGARSFYTSCTSPKITGDLFLFSAALDLTVKGVGPLGDILERVLRSPRLSEFLDKRDSQKPLVADNPVKYAYVDKDGARELCRLIKEVDVLVEGFDKMNPYPKRVFAAHSYADNTANINGIKNLQDRTAKKNFKSYYIDKKVGVTHGGLVLANDVVGDSGKVCSGKNVRFERMIKALSRFVEGGQ